MNDEETRIIELKKKVREFREKRGWRGESSKDIALSLVLEASELLEHFQWKSGDEVKNEARLHGPICDELADVLWWVLVMAESLNIDLAKAFETKYKKNEKKYPAESFSPELSEEERRKVYYKIKAKYRGGHPLAESENDQ